MKPNHSDFNKVIEFTKKLWGVLHDSSPSGDEAHDHVTKHPHEKHDDAVLVTLNGSSYVWQEKTNKSS